MALATYASFVWLGDTSELEPIGRSIVVLALCIPFFFSLRLAEERTPGGRLWMVARLVGAQPGCGERSRSVPVNEWLSIPGVDRLPKRAFVVILIPIPTISDNAQVYYFLPTVTQMCT